MPSPRISEFLLAARYLAVPDHVDMVMDRVPDWARTPLCRAAVAEAIANAILHGVCGLPTESRESDNLESWLDVVDQSDARTPPIDFVQVSVSSNSDQCTVKVTDPGEGFNWREAPLRPRRGLSIVRAGFEEVRWNDRGNCISLSTSRRAPW